MTEKQIFINACNALDGDEFIESCALFLQDVCSKEELNEFITVIGGVFEFKNITSSSVLTNFCLLFRDKAYDLLLKNGDVPECNAVKMYHYFILCDLPIDNRFVAYEGFVDGSLYTEDVSDMDRVYLIVLRFFASFVNSKNYAFERFLSAIALIDFMQADQISLSPLIIDFVHCCSESATHIIEIMGKNWNKEFYFSLSKLQRRSTFNWDLHCIWNVSSCHSHPLWISFYKAWKEILFEHVKRDECDEAMYVHFFIYHKMGNSFQTQEEWRMFNDEIDIPMSAYYKEFANRMGLAKCKPVQSEGKKIIGFLWDRLVENSPFKVAYSLWKALYGSQDFRDKFEIRVYVMSYFEKSYNELDCELMVNKLGISVFDGAAPFYDEGVNHSHLKKAIYIRQKIIDDGVDIMIHGNNYDINDFLVATRTAPKQIYWSHGNAMFDIDGVDKKISHCNISEHREYFDIFSIPVDNSIFYNPPVFKDIILQERSKYPEDSLILGVIGRLVKVDSDEYLEVIAQIMHQNPKTIFIAAGPGNTDILREKTQKLGIADRFYMPGYVDPHLYGHIIDFWLDTFPLKQGESLEEYITKGGLFLTLVDDEYLKYCSDESVVDVLKKAEQELKSDFAWYLQESFSVKSLFGEMHMSYVSSSQSEYVSKANLFINSALHMRTVKAFTKKVLELRGRQDINLFIQAILR